MFRMGTSFWNSDGVRTNQLVVMNISLKAALTLALSISVATAGLKAQAAPEAAQSEELQPRIIGTTGTMKIGFAGYADRFFSSENSFSTNYTAQVDIGRFIARKLAVRGGLAGTGNFGGGESDLPTGRGAPALYAFGGVLYYFAPQSMWSIYSGGEYWAQLTQRADPDAGSVVAKLGIEGAVSSRVSIFVDGGYGFGLTKGEDDELLTRFVGQIGLRLKL